VEEMDRARIEAEYWGLGFAIGAIATEWRIAQWRYMLPSALQIVCFLRLVAAMRSCFCLRRGRMVVYLICDWGSKCTHVQAQAVQQMMSDLPPSFLESSNHSLYY